MNPPKETHITHYCPCYEGNLLIDFNKGVGHYCHCIDIKLAYGKGIPTGVTAKEYNERNKQFFVEAKQEDAFEISTNTTNATYIFETEELAEQFSKDRVFDKATCQMKTIMKDKDKDTGAHYRFQLTQSVTEVDLQRGYVVINLDPYRIADCYGITNHAIFSALKKLLVAGGRGFKDTAQDIADSIGALQRWQEMRKEQLTLAMVSAKNEQHSLSTILPALNKEWEETKSKENTENSKPAVDTSLQEALKIKRLVNYE